MRRQRHFQNARCTRVGGLNQAPGIEHNDAGGQVVQDGLQVASGGIELHQTALDGASGIRQLLGHFGKGTG